MQQVVNRSKGNFYCMEMNHFYLVCMEKAGWCGSLTARIFWTSLLTVAFLCNLALVLSHYVSVGFLPQPQRHANYVWDRRLSQGNRDQPFAGHILYTLSHTGNEPGPSRCKVTALTTEPLCRHGQQQHSNKKAIA